MSLVKQGPGPSCQLGGYHAKRGVIREDLLKRGGGRGALLPPQGPTEAEEQAGQRAQEVGQADAVRIAALWPRPVRAIEEIGVVEGLWASEATPELQSVPGLVPSTSHMGTHSFTKCHPVGSQ